MLFFFLHINFFFFTYYFFFASNFYIYIYIYIYITYYYFFYLLLLFFFFFLYYNKVHFSGIPERRLCGRNALTELHSTTKTYRAVPPPNTCRSVSSDSYHRKMHRTITDGLLNRSSAAPQPLLNRSSPSFTKNLEGTQARLASSSYTACPTDTDYFPPLLTEGVDYCCLEYGLSSSNSVANSISEASGSGLTPYPLTSMFFKLVASRSE